MFSVAVVVVVVFEILFGVNERRWRNYRNVRLCTFWTNALETRMRRCLVYGNVIRNLCVLRGQSSSLSRSCRRWGFGLRFWRGSWSAWDNLTRSWGTCLWKTTFTVTGTGRWSDLDKLGKETGGHKHFFGCLLAADLEYLFIYFQWVIRTYLGRRSLHFLERHRGNGGLGQELWADKQGVHFVFLGNGHNRI